MRTTIAASVTLLTLIGVSTVVEAQEEPAPPAEQDDGAPPPTTLEIVVTVPAEPEPAPAGATPTATEPAANPPSATSDDGAGTPGTDATTTTASGAADEPPVTTAATEQTGSDGTSTTVATSTSPTTSVAGAHTADQQTVVTGTQVAIAVTGSNEIETEQPPGGPPAAVGAEVTTGDAAAIGSIDENVITQQAAVVLTGEAIARVLQIALILNIGAAFANSGGNQISASGGGEGTAGQVATGDAEAIGNDIASYVTQAASAEASSAMDDAASQEALSLFLGVAIADSGMNTVSGSGSAGSGGAVDTGSATAIGNRSLTDITQQAIAVGADGATLSITQRATVLNLGFAVANSGINDISGVAGTMLAASDQEDDALALELFEMLLPALLDSYGYGAGSGAIASGDASAIGNQSETYVQQVASVTASGDGSAAIDQNVVVANVGAAGANTGGNVLGRRTLDPESARAVVTMAAFLAQLLSMVHQTPESATTLATSSQVLEIPFGDLVLQLDGRFDALDTAVSGGGSHADVRQISIVVSLGVARADSGRNSTEVVSTSRLLAAVNAVLPEIVSTGDATATNRSLVVICQRSNAADVPCLAPPVEPPTTEPPGVTPVGEITPTAGDPSPTPPAVPTATVARPADPGGPRGFATPSVRQELPATGSETRTLLLVATLLVLVGAGLLLVRRRPQLEP